MKSFLFQMAHVSSMSNIVGEIGVEASPSEVFNTAKLK